MTGVEPAMRAGHLLPQHAVAAHHLRPPRVGVLAIHDDQMIGQPVESVGVQAGGPHGGRWYCTHLVVEDPVAQPLRGGD